MTQSEAAVTGSLNGFHLRIESIGPVRAAQIELGDYTLITSTNSLGKTVVATTAWRLNQIFNLLDQKLLPFLIGQSFGQVARTKKLEARLRNPRTFQRTLSAESTRAAVLSEVRKLLKSAEIRNLLLRQFMDAFNVTPIALISVGKQRGVAELSDESFGNLSVVLRDEKSTCDLDLTEAYLKDKLEQMTGRLSPLSDPNFWRLISGSEPSAGFGAMLLVATERLLSTPESFGTVFVPTDRISLPNLWTHTRRSTPSVDGSLESIVSSLKHARIFPISPSPAGPGQRFSPAVESFLDTCLSEIERRANGRIPLSKAATRLIGLSVTPVKGGRLSFATRKGPIDPLLVSSGAVQLTLLALASEAPGVTNLYVEEPEVNLHADKELEVADYIWELRKAAFITSHGDRFMSRVCHRWAEQPKGVSRVSLRVYNIDEGVSEQLEVDEKGQVDEIRSIRKAEDQLLRGSRVS